MKRLGLPYMGSNQNNAQNRRITKLNEIIVLQIRNMQYEGFRKRDIVLAFKEYSFYAVDRVLRGDSWTNVVYIPKEGNVCQD